jgi:hypothetical protein
MKKYWRRAVRRFALVDRWIPWLTSGAVLRPRWVAGGMYFFFLIAGVLFLLFPPLKGLEELVGEMNIWAWHIFLLIGSAISLGGCVFKRPLVEAIGLPLLIATMLAYAVISLAIQMMTGSGWGNAAMFMGITFGLTGRCIEMLHLGNIIDEIQNRED